MNRRSVIQKLVLAAGGFIVVPSCVQQPGSASVVLQHFNFTDLQENLLKSIATAIIPATDSPGAGDLGCHLFVLKMVDDCYDEKAQQQFVRGLNNFDDYAKNSFGVSFLQCSEQQQQELLSNIEGTQGIDTDITAFYTLMKKTTIEGYMTSKYVLTNINKYEFVPSVKYDGYVRVQD